LILIFFDQNVDIIEINRKIVNIQLKSGLNYS